MRYWSAWRRGSWKKQDLFMAASVRKNGCNGVMFLIPREI